MIGHTVTQRLGILALAAGLGGLTNPVFATVLEVEIDTTSLGGTGQLAFDLTNGDNAINNTVTITAFSTAGSLGVAATAGGVTGTLPGAVTLADTSFFNELLQPLTFANSISFTLTLTDNFAGGLVPDQLAFFLLDSGTPPLPLFATSDLTGADALFVVDLGVAGGLQVYQATASSVATWTVTSATIPEPGVLLLVGSGLLGLAGRRWR